MSQCFSLGLSAAHPSVRGLTGRIAFLCVLAVAVFVSLACSPPRAASGDSPTPAPPSPDSAVPSASPSPENCAALPSGIRQVLRAPDPEAFAAQIGRRFERGRLLVAISLRGEPGTLAADHALEEFQRVDAYAEALVLVSRLCALAGDPRVLTVSLPAIAIPAGSN